MEILPEYLVNDDKKLDEIKESFFENLKSCTLCPHKCKVDRYSKEVGICKAPLTPVVASFSVHMGEEPPISGVSGSGTIFFSYCSLKCIYCQNYPISQLQNGTNKSSEELANIMLHLQEKGCHNINLITPTHFLPYILDAILIAKKMGLHIPIVYNTSGWESLETVKKLKYFVDIYLVDARYSSNVIAFEFSKVKNYKEINNKVLIEMRTNQPKDIFDKKGFILKGIIVRILILPNNSSDTIETIKRIKETLGLNTYISLMSQYYPCYKALNHDVLGRKITYKEYSVAKNYINKAGFFNGWIQEYEP